MYGQWNKPDLKGMAMTDFTPVEALAGGALIGLSAVLAMALYGRIAGISGILGGFFATHSPDRSWRGGFLLGLIAAPLVYWALTGIKPEVTLVVPVGFIVLGGFLVGVGTALGGGCTSGHGVCGIARLSKRSIIATVCFMATGFATVYVMRHIVGVW